MSVLGTILQVGMSGVLTRKTGTRFFQVWRESGLHIFMSQKERGRISNRPLFLAEKPGEDRIAESG